MVAGPSSPDETSLLLWNSFLGAAAQVPIDVTNRTCGATACGSRLHQVFSILAQSLYMVDVQACVLPQVRHKRCPDSKDRLRTRAQRQKQKHKLQLKLYRVRSSWSSVLLLAFIRTEVACTQCLVQV